MSGEPAKEAIEEAAVASQKAVEFFRTPAEFGEKFIVPRMALRVQGELALLEDTEVFEADWELFPFDAVPTPDHLSLLGGALKVSQGGEIDIDEATGRVFHRFLPNLQRDLGLAYKPENWDEVRLAAWFCTHLPERLLTHESKRAFVTEWITQLLRMPQFSLGRLNQQKFLLRTLLESRIKELRQSAARKSYQQLLFEDGNKERVIVDAAYFIEFHPHGYAPSKDYDNRFGMFPFAKHYYSRVADFDSAEEFQCAVELDHLAQQGRIRFWVRNLVRKDQSSFYLQKADGKFYPDFVCVLPNDKILIVEYKGANGWTDAEDDRRIGGLWAEMSKDTCRFVMIKEKRWDWLEPKL